MSPRIYYDNILVLAKDGRMLSTIGKRRKEFYLKNNLAKEVGPYGDYPDCIQLKFQPDTVTVKPHNLVLGENICVVCGGEENLELHHVMPYFIRRRLPVKYREHSHHWCVLACCDCHKMADDKAKELYGGLFKYISEHAKRDNSLLRLRKLVDGDHWENIPEDRQLEILFDAGFESAEEVLAADIDTSTYDNSIFVDKWVENHVASFTSIEDMYILYRSKFLELSPRHLPDSFLTLTFEEKDEEG